MPRKADKVADKKNGKLTEKRTNPELDEMVALNITKTERIQRPDRAPITLVTFSAGIREGNLTDNASMTVAIEGDWDSYGKLETAARERAYLILRRLTVDWPGPRKK